MIVWAQKDVRTRGCVRVLYGGCCSVSGAIATPVAPAHRFDGSTTGEGENHEVVREEAAFHSEKFESSEGPERLFGVGMIEKCVVTAQQRQRRKQSIGRR